MIDMAELSSHVYTPGMHTVKEKPVVVNGQIVIRPIMIIALTYDHRLLDGREATTFLGESQSYGTISLSY